MFPISGTFTLQHTVPADIAFECAGNAASIRQCALQCTKPGGQTVLLGTGPQAIDISPVEIAPMEVDIISSFTYLPKDVKIFLEMLQSGKLNFDGFVTDIIKLDDVVEKGLSLEAKSKNIKILIEPSLK